MSLQEIISPYGGDKNLNCNSLNCNSLQIAEVTAFSDPVYGDGTIDDFTAVINGSNVSGGSVISQFFHLIGDICHYNVTVFGNCNINSSCALSLTVNGNILPNNFPSTLKIGHGIWTVNNINLAGVNSGLCLVYTNAGTKNITITFQSGAPGGSTFDFNATIEFAFKTHI